MSVQCDDDAAVKKFEHRLLLQSTGMLFVEFERLRYLPYACDCPTMQSPLKGSHETQKLQELRIIRLWQFKSPHVC